MKRSVRLGALLFLIKLLACHPLKRAFHQHPTRWCIFAHSCATNVLSSVTTFCVEWWVWDITVRNSGSIVPNLTVRTGLAERRHTRLLSPSAFQACYCSL